HDVFQIREAVYGFAHVGNLVAVATIPMFHPPVVFKKGDVITETFDPKDLAKFVIHFDSVFIHEMADRMTLDAS
ncbi:MAG: hypothetical protein LJE96_22605, partial [Deltaproteobacteria bacterium]|nr:hypothetical protein [Deltaproteobacteria bacterium]